MNFSFGIITNGENDSYVNEIVYSIRNEKIPNYEIIIVGKTEVNGNDILNVPFNEKIKDKWITKKKNIITYEANYDNIVYMHDYIKLVDGWYEGQLKSGNDFKIRMDKITNFDGTRFRDWVLTYANLNFLDNIVGMNCLLPYDIIHLSKYMYISGSYWVAKKYVMEEFPLEELLSWGQGEDTYWSKQVRQKYDFSMNINSEVKILKPNKERAFSEPNEELVNYLKNLI